MRTPSLLFIFLLALVSAGIAQESSEPVDAITLTPCQAIDTLLSTIVTEFDGLYGDFSYSTDDADWYYSNIWWQDAAECDFLYDPMMEMWLFEAFFYKGNSWTDANTQYASLCDNIRSCLPQATVSRTGGEENGEASMTLMAEDGSIVQIELMRVAEDQEFQVALSVSEF